MSQRSTIVVIDDTSSDLRLLSAILDGAGYRIRPFASSRLGLAAILAEPPDLILLDATMPEMDGFEVCRRLKDEPAVAEIPVIFVSGHEDTEHKLEAFRAGGVDYVTKPFHPQEVEARVHAHIELGQTRRALEQNYARLQELEGLRDHLSSMAVHDLCTPLNAMALTLELLDTDPRLDEGLRADVDTARGCTVKMAQLVASLLDVARLECASMPIQISAVTPRELVRDAFGHLGVLGRDARVVVQELPDVRLSCDPKLGSRVLVNFVMNALSFVSSAAGRVEIGAAERDGFVRIFVSDNGPGIAPEAQSRIFEKFTQLGAGSARRVGRSTGLGLTFCKLAVEAQGGNIGLESELGRGSTFWFELRAAR